MKVALLCPSNLLYMPYVDNYRSILDTYNIKYDIINWDRFGIKENIKYSYRDSKIGHKRGILDYLKYRNYLLKNVRNNNYDKIIVFGVPIAFFIKKFLYREFAGKYIIDIRDHHSILKYYNMRKIIDNSSFTVLSSPGFKEWLPPNRKYIVNHNTRIIRLDDFKKPVLFESDKINISNIGSIRDYQENIDLINSLRNNNMFAMYYHGDGAVSQDILRYIDENKIANVYFTGRYEREEEEELYDSSDLINILIYSDGINNKTLLPNRLYNSLIYGKPILAFSGSFLADTIEKYDLGLVINTFKNIDEKICDYLINFDIERYELNRIKYFEEVITDNNIFRNELVEFLLNVNSI